jgi:large repetitive protein
MKKGLFILLIFCFSLTVISCGDLKEESTTTDTTAPVIAEVTAVTTPTNDSTPDYTFSSDEAGTITYGGSCSSSTSIVISGNNTITLNSLSDGTYSDCTIAIRSSTGYLSNILTITSFIVDSTAATLTEVTAVTTTNDNTPNYIFSSSEAGTITYGGSCSSSTTSVTTGSNTITLVSLSEGTYSDCTITVTDTSSNSVTLNISSFVIDTTAPTIAEVTVVTTPNTGTTPNYTFSSDEAGTITYGGSCSSSTTSAISGNNTITLVSLSLGTYSDCTITVTDTAGNVSSTLTFTSFTVVEPEQMGGAMQGVELSLSTVVTTIAGTGNTGSADGTGTSASFYSPQGITTDGTNLYVTNRNNLIRQIVISTVVVTTVAGTGSSGSANGTGTSASFDEPEDITTDGTNLYVADTNNHLIRQIVISTGVVTTVAGTGSSGSANGTGTSASFDQPKGITTDGTNLYVSDTENHLIRQIVISTGVVTTVAGTGSSGSANGTGTSASFGEPRGITTDGTNLYVATNNNLIRQIVISTGVVTTVAGTGSAGTADGTGTSASFTRPKGITTDGTNLYVADDDQSGLVRQIVISTGVVTKVSDRGVIREPKKITTDGTNLYVTDSNHIIRKIE